MDRQVSRKDVPSFEIVEEKIKEIDGSIIVLRIFYIFMHIAYKVQLIKNDKQGSIGNPRKLLEGVKGRNSVLEEEIIRILDTNIQHADCWNKI